ncbi:hypothetical protein M011DRAFT_527418 [Sporormia fimetaria CBS 119925]|uniref:Uncharacterized protein n=1 Tax=Sporormia fimetaria CBS 119925 TaxID=1340428 RepID=A0A6A6V5Z4_9PLEO|nr:hypothetical protein M011DRAFT_527418 [Sporormia fimetaria CBS 119925]
MAALWQSKLGIASAKSLFAILQCAGMGGYGAAIRWGGRRHGPFTAQACTVLRAIELLHDLFVSFLPHPPPTSTPHLHTNMPPRPLRRPRPRDPEGMNKSLNQYTHEPSPTTGYVARLTEPNSNAPYITVDGKKVSLAAPAQYSKSTWDVVSTALGSTSDAVIEGVTGALSGCAFWRLLGSVGVASGLVFSGVVKTVTVEEIVGTGREWTWSLRVSRILNFGTRTGSKMVDERSDVKAAEVKNDEFKDAEVNSQAIRSEEPKSKESNSDNLDIDQPTTMLDTTTATTQKKKKKRNRNKKKKATLEE